ncbi:MAG: CAF17-like 4Fe-4S cluster assembly/insertion protein YgfZ [Planctomycetota bacterium]
MSPETAASSPTTAELAALRTGAAVSAPQRRVVIGASGPDALEWLERLVSSPVRDLSAGQFALATLMDGKGKLRADLRVLRAEWPGAAPPQTNAAPARGETLPETAPLLLDFPASLAPGLMRLLDMFILRDRVALRDGSSSHAFLALLGPQAEAVLQRLGQRAPRDGEVLAATIGAGGPPALVMASRLYGAPGFDILLPVSERPETERRLREAGCTGVGAAALNVQRIAAGVPWFPEDLGEGVIPLEAGLDAQVSITKGCYPGQEVVARITNLGQVTRKLVRLASAAAPDSGAALPAAGTTLFGTEARAGQEAGKLTSVAVDPSTGRIVALGFLRRAFLSTGTVVLAGSQQLSVQGEVRA